MAMVAVIFESWPTNAQKYVDMREAQRPHLANLDGFISIERFRSVGDPAKLVAPSFGGTQPRSGPGAIMTCTAIQAKSREDVFRDYRLRVAAVLRDYGM